MFTDEKACHAIMKISEEKIIAQSSEVVVERKGRRHNLI